MKDPYREEAWRPVEKDELTSEDLRRLAEAFASLQHYFAAASGDLPSWAEDARLLISILDAEAPGWRGAVLRTGQVARRIR